MKLLVHEKKIEFSKDRNAKYSLFVHKDKIMVPPPFYRSIQDVPKSIREPIRTQGCCKAKNTINSRRSDRSSNFVDSFSGSAPFACRQHCLLSQRSSLFTSVSPSESLPTDCLPSSLSLSRQYN